MGFVCCRIVVDEAEPMVGTAQPFLVLVCGEKDSPTEVCRVVMFLGRIGRWLNFVLPRLDLRTPVWVGWRDVWWMMEGKGGSVVCCFQVG